MTYFSIGDVSDGQFPIGVLRRLSDASPTGALREGVLPPLGYFEIGVTGGVIMTRAFYFARNCVLAAKLGQND